MKLVKLSGRSDHQEGGKLTKKSALASGLAFLRYNLIGLAACPYPQRVLKLAGFKVAFQAGVTCSMSLPAEGTETVNYHWHGLLTGTLQHVPTRRGY